MPSLTRVGTHQNLTPVRGGLMSWSPCRLWASSPPNCVGPAAFAGSGPTGPRLIYVGFWVRLTILTGSCVLARPVVYREPDQRCKENLLCTWGRSCFYFIFWVVCRSYAKCLIGCVRGIVSHNTRCFVKSQS